jgi:hypothetical protein
MTQGRIRDGVLGTVLVGSTVLAHVYQYTFILIPLVTGILLLMSAFTGICFLNSYLGKCGIPK